jgi:hypothetical protein
MYSTLGLADRLESYLLPVVIFFRSLCLTWFYLMLAKNNKILFSFSDLFSGDSASQYFPINSVVFIHVNSNNSGLFRQVRK